MTHRLSNPPLCGAHGLGGLCIQGRSIVTHSAMCRPLLGRPARTAARLPGGRQFPQLPEAPVPRRCWPPSPLPGHLMRLLLLPLPSCHAAASAPPQHLPDPPLALAPLQQSLHLALALLELFPPAAAVCCASPGRSGCAATPSTGSTSCRCAASRAPAAQTIRILRRHCRAPCGWLTGCDMSLLDPAAATEMSQGRRMRPWERPWTRRNVRLPMSRRGMCPT